MDMNKVDEVSRLIETLKKLKGNVASIGTGIEGVLFNNNHRAYPSGATIDAHKYLSRETINVIGVLAKIDLEAKISLVEQKLMDLGVTV